MATPSASGDRMLAAAVAEWAQALGPAHVVTDSALLGAMESTTFQTNQRILAALRPADREQVVECVRIARHHRIPLYPLSGGKNWGYGSRVPATDGNVILDLSRLNRIVEFDEELAYVTIEPGVTQRQLFEFLAARGSTLWMDPTSASAEASVLGNVLERGHGLTPYADHASQVAGFEVILASGECLHTGYGRFGPSPLRPLDPYGVGPALDGLFAQSNLGIVTQLSVWLMPAPQCVQAAFFALEDDATMAEAVDALRPLRLDGSLRMGPRFGNIYRNLRYAPLPAEYAGATLQLADALRIGAPLGLRAYGGTAAVYGTRQHVQAVRERLQALLPRFAPAITFVSPEDVVARGAPLEVRRQRGLMRLLCGELAGEGIAGPMCYWRKPQRPAAGFDPDRDRCGIIWLAPAAPFRGRDAARVNELARTVLFDHGFEPDVAFLALRERMLHFHISIAYDRDAPGDDQRAMKCHDDLMQRLLAAGYWPHRLGIHSSAALSGSEPAFTHVLARIKDALDPDRILAPGRYEPLPEKRT